MVAAVAWYGDDSAPSGCNCAKSRWGDLRLLGSNGVAMPAR